MKTTVIQDVHPSKWKEHCYGLAPERWSYLSGKSYWITGAGTGYGRCIAVALASAGAKVILTGRRVGKLQESIEEMSSLNIPTNNCQVLQADLTNSEGILEACVKLKTISDTLDGVVNNAAIPEKPGSKYPLMDGSLEYWNKIIATNVTAPWLLTRTIFPHMLNSGHGKVLFITSEAGWANPTPGNGMYKVSKTALNGLGRAIAMEFAHSHKDDDIQMNVLVPGEARTEMNQGSTRSPYSIVSMALLLLSQSPGGPNGRFFHRDGRHLQFCNAEPYENPLN